MEKEKVFPSIFYRILKKRFEGERILEYSKLGISERYKSQNFLFRPEIYQGQFFYINHLFTVLGSSMATPFPIMFFFFITGKMYFPTSLFDVVI